MEAAVKPTKILLTGASGYVGHVLAHALLEGGHEVWTWQHRHPAPKRCRHQEGQDWEAFTHQLEAHGVTHVIHAAGSHVAADDGGMADQSFAAKVAMWTAKGHDQSCRRLLLISSSHACAAPGTPPRVITLQTPDQPTSSYGLQKKKLEEMVLAVQPKTTVWRLFPLVTQPPRGPWGLALSMMVLSGIDLFQGWDAPRTWLMASTLQQACRVWVSDDKVRENICYLGEATPLTLSELAAKKMHLEGRTLKPWSLPLKLKNGLPQAWQDKLNSALVLQPQDVT